MNCILDCILIGGGLGGLLGYFNKSNPGMCPLTANWKRGAVYGAILALLFYSISVCGGKAATMNQSTANVTRITDTSFDAAVIQSSNPVVVDCYATWCAPCRELSPVVDSLADQYAGRIKFVKVNIDESPKTDQRFQVGGIPLLLFFKDGKLTGSSLGLIAKEDLARQLNDLIATNVPAAAPGK
ncbi:MAG TPA: thioredoxin [Candidatus Sulfopaludibacter sp.]|nr:thioredoxin [Candidatus Sulfopaludibacter sp.]